MPTRCVFYHVPKNKKIKVTYEDYEICDESRVREEIRSKVLTVIYKDCVGNREMQSFTFSFVCITSSNAYTSHIFFQLCFKWAVRVFINYSVNLKVMTNLETQSQKKKYIFMPCHVHATKKKIRIPMRSWILDLQPIPPSTKPVPATIDLWWARPLITRFISSTPTTNCCQVVNHWHLLFCQPK